jgi:predicted transcriptional regulator
MPTTTVNISFPAQLLKTMDQLARREARSRSELLREAARMYVERKHRWAQLLAFWRREARRLGVKPEDVQRAIAAYRGGQRTSS